MKWEYKDMPSVSIEDMNVFGEQGWELVSIVILQHPKTEFHGGVSWRNSLWTYWKRPKNEA